MAEAAVGPLVNPGIFNSDDPRGSEYAANQSALEHQYETTLAGDKETLQDNRTSAAYQRSLIAKQEPLSYKANEAKSNAEGLLESGVNAGRRGNLAADFISKGTSVSQKMTQAEARRIAADNIARESEQSGTAKNLASYNNDKLKWEAEHPPVAPAPAEPNPNATNVPGLEITKPGGTAQAPSKSLFGGRSIVNPGSANSYIVAANGQRYPNTEWNRDHPQQMRK